MLQQVSKNFREIFAELAPGGSGQLMMQKRLRPGAQAEPNPEGDDEDAGPSDRPDVVERYTGVNIKVKVFTCWPRAFIGFMFACVHSMWGIC